MHTPTTYEEGSRRKKSKTEQKQKAHIVHCRNEEALCAVMMESTCRLTVALECVQLQDAEK